MEQTQGLTLEMDKFGRPLPSAPPAYQQYVPPAQQYYPPQYGPTSTAPSAPMQQQYQQPQTSFLPMSAKDKFDLACENHEISDFFASKLRKKLQGVEIILILDNSGSMDGPAHEGSNETRWQELKKTCSVVISVASAIDTNGVDIYFLNSQCGTKMLRNITDASQIDRYFASPPAGGTPLTETLEAAISDKMKTMDPSQKILALVATDGEPTGQGGVKGFKDYLRYKRNSTQIPVTILACTDDKAALRYLNRLDKQIAGLDVIDDYSSELKQIRKARGKHFRFTYGDYIAKSLLGSSDRQVDKLDERKCTIC
jgi:hypothetical protein